MTIKSPNTLRQLLDRICAGQSWVDAMAAIGARSESAGWTWKRASREAEAAGDTTSVFHLDWPLGTEPDFLHNLLDKARNIRGEILSSPLFAQTFAIEDGRVKFQTDDFGGIVLDDNGVPIAEQVVVKQLARRIRPGDPSPIRQRRGRPPISGTEELQSSSYSGNKPKGPPYVGSALSDYVSANSPRPKPDTPLTRDLRNHLAKASDPNRASARPSYPVTIMGRGGNNDPQERVSTPSNQTGLPANGFPDRPRQAAPQSKPAAVDYSRHAPPVRIDSAGRG